MNHPAGITLLIILAPILLYGQRNESNEGKDTFYEMPHVRNSNEVKFFDWREVSKTGNGVLNNDYSFSLRSWYGYENEDGFEAIFVKSIQAEDRPLDSELAEGTFLDEHKSEVLTILQLLFKEDNNLIISFTNQLDTKTFRYFENERRFLFTLTSESFSVAELELFVFNYNNIVIDLICYNQ